MSVAQIMASLPTPAPSSIPTYGVTRAPTPVSTKNLNKLASWMHPVAEDDDDDDDAIKPTGSPTQAPTKMVVPTHKPTVNPLAIDDDNSFDFAVHD